MKNIPFEFAIVFIFTIDIYTKTEKKSDDKAQRNLEYICYIGEILICMDEEEQSYTQSYYQSK